MNKLKKLIKSSDCYSYKVSFYPKSQEEKKTVFGGLLSIFSLIFTLIAIYLSLLPILISKVNISTTSNYFYKDPNLIKEKPFSGSDQISAYLFWYGNEANIHTISEYYKIVHSYRNGTDWIKKLYECRIVDQGFDSDQNQTLVRHIKFEIPLKDLNLFELQAQVYGGNLYSSYIGLTPCVNLKNDSSIINPESLNNCSIDINKFLSFNFTQIYQLQLWMYIPNYSLKFNNDTFKMDVRNRSYVSQFFFKPYYDEYFNMANSLHFYEFDKGAIFSEITNKTVINFDHIWTYSNLNIQNVPKESSNNGYQLFILLSQESTYITTYYKIYDYKLFDSFSYLGGLLKFISFLRIFTFLWNSYSQDKMMLKLVTNQEYFKDFMNNSVINLKSVEKINETEKNIPKEKVDKIKDINEKLLIRKEPIDPIIKKQETIKYFEWIKIHFCLCCFQNSLKKQRILELKSIFNMNQILEKLSEIDLMKQLLLDGNEIERIEKMVKNIKYHDIKKLLNMNNSKCEDKLISSDSVENLET